eukprot:UN03049
MMHKQVKVSLLGWGVDYSKSNERYKIADTIEFKGSSDDDGDDDELYYVNGVAVYMISNYKIHNNEEKLTFVNNAIQKAIEKTESVLNLTFPITSDNFHFLNDVTNGGIGQNDHFDGPALDMTEWLFPTIKPNPNVDLQPQLNTLTQDGALYAYIIRLNESILDPVVNNNDNISSSELLSLDNDE